MFANRSFSHILNILSIFVLATLPAIPAQAAPSKAVEAASSMLQFTSGGHALGFTSQGMYAAAGSHALHVNFVDANPVRPRSDTPAGPQGKAAPLSRVTYAGLWDGISLVYAAGPGSIYTTTYTLAPGADVKDIRLRYNTPLTLNQNGALEMTFEAGTLIESAPIAWQDIDGRRVPVQAAFRVREQEVTFTLGKYDPQYALTIDPTLTWNTFLGGTGFDEGSDIAVDGNGNVYVIGYSESSWGIPIIAHTGNYDIYIAKINNSGVRQWHTFLGGSDWDFSQGIALDGSGNIYVTGYSESTWGTPIRTFAGSFDAFVAKLNNSGVLQWSTFLGGTGFDIGNGIALDGDGNIYATGESNVTWGAPIDPYEEYYEDAFIAKLDSSGTLLWNTFLGGASQKDEGYNIDVAASGNIYVTGESNNEAFAAKFNTSGALQWNTIFGGTSLDRGYGITVDGDESAYVTGFSWDTWGAAPVDPFGGGIMDGFAAKLNSIGELQWNTFLGSTEDDSGYDIAVDINGNSYITGYSGAAWGTPLDAYARYDDAFVAKLNSVGSRQWNAFLGGSGADYGYGIALDGDANIYTTGYSSTTWGSPVFGFAGMTDGFAAKLDLTPPTVLSSLRADPNPTNNSSVDFTVTFSESVTGVNASDFSLTTSGISGATMSAVSGSGSNYTVTVNTGSGSGTIRLDVIDDDSILDGASNRLGGGGTGNGGFITGEVYLIPPIVQSSIRAHPNPTKNTSVDFIVTFTAPVTGVDISDFSLTTSGVTGAAVAGVSGTGANYTVTVNTGSDTGTIRLDLFDDNTIIDGASIPLGGAGSVNGDFTSGEVYSIDKTPPTVSSITRLNVNPSAARSVSFLVTFSEPVSGVETGDFSLTTSGLTSAFISNVIGSGATRTAVVNTGVGDGTIRLDVVDDDTILDVVSNPLDGSFTGGDIYDIDKPDLPPPALRSPRDNAVTNLTTPIFRWTSVNGGSTYEIEIATDDIFSNIVDGGTFGTLSFTPTAPLVDDVYYWHVRARTAGGQPGAWSAIRSFTVDTSGPAAPLLTSPVNSASIRSAAFRWGAVPGAAAYEFQLDNELGFTDPAIISSIVRGASRRLPPLPAGTYYWRVRAKDALGNWGAWSAPFSINFTGF